MNETLQRCLNAIGETAGAVAIQAPEDQAFLQRTCRRADLDGHVRTFAANLPDAPRGDA